MFHEGFCCFCTSAFTDSHICFQNVKKNSRDKSWRRGVKHQSLTVILPYFMERGFWHNEHVDHFQSVSSDFCRLCWKFPSNSLKSLRGRAWMIYAFVISHLLKQGVNIFVPWHQSSLQRSDVLEESSRGTLVPAFLLLPAKGASWWAVTSSLVCAQTLSSHRANIWRLVVQHFPWRGQSQFPLLNPWQEISPKRRLFWQ